MEAHKHTSGVKEGPDPSFLSKHSVVVFCSQVQFLQRVVAYILELSGIESMMEVASFGHVLLYILIL